MHNICEAPCAQNPLKVHAHKHSVSFLVYKTWKEVPRAACWVPKYQFTTSPPGYINSDFSFSLGWPYWRSLFWHPVIQVWVPDWSFSSSFDPCQIGTEGKLGSYPCSRGKWVFTAPQESAFERLSKHCWWDRAAFIGKARRENSFSGTISKHFKAFFTSLFK